MSAPRSSRPNGKSHAIVPSGPVMPSGPAGVITIEVTKMRTSGSPEAMAYFAAMQSAYEQPQQKALPGSSGSNKVSSRPDRAERFAAATEKSEESFFRVFGSMLTRMEIPKVSLSDCLNKLGDLLEKFDKALTDTDPMSEKSQQRIKKCLDFTFLMLTAMFFGKKLIGIDDLRIITVCTKVIDQFPTVNLVLTTLAMTAIANAKHHESDCNQIQLMMESVGNTEVPLMCHDAASKITEEDFKNLQKFCSNAVAVFKTNMAKNLKAPRASNLPVFDDDDDDFVPVMKSPFA